MSLKNLGAERGLLAILVKNPECIFTVDEFLVAEDFSDECNQNIYRIVRSLSLEDVNIKIDHLVLKARAVELNLEDFDDQFDLEMYDALQETQSDESNLRRMIKSVHEASAKRKLVKVMDEEQNYLRQTDDGIITSLSHVEGSVLGFVDELNGKDQAPKQGGEGFIEWANEVADDPEARPWATCYERYDKMVGGARRDCLHVITARPKCGKSFFALNIALDQARKGIPVLITDTELSYVQWRLRLGSLISEVPMYVIESGEWKSNKQHIDSIKKAAEEMKTLPIYHKEVIGFSMDEIVAAMRSWLYREVGFEPGGRSRKCVFVHDYIKMQSSKDMGKNLQEYQALGFACTSLKNFAAKYETCIYSFGQLNRDGDVAASDRISWFASSVSNMYKKEQEEIEDDGPSRGNRKLFVKASRHGEPHEDDDCLFFHFKGEIGSMREDKHRAEMENKLPNKNPQKPRKNSSKKV